MRGRSRTAYSGSRDRRRFASVQDVGDGALPLHPPFKPDAGQAGARRSPTATAGCSSRSGTASAASCSATATRSSWPAATSGRSPATSPSCSTRCGRRCPTGASSTARSSSPTRDGHGLDFDALLQRIHPAESRVRRLAAETPASFVAFDLLALGDESLLDAAAARAPRALLDGAAPGAARLPHAGEHRPGDRRAEWFGRFEGAGLDGVVAKRLDDPYQPDKRALVKVKHERTADCAVAGYRIHKDGNGVGSLLLGLYDDDGPAAPRRRRRRRSPSSSAPSCSPSSSR